MKVSELVRTLSGKEIKTIMTGAECEFIGSLAYYMRLLKGEETELDIEINPLVRAEFINRMQSLGVKIEGRVAGSYNVSNFCRPMEKVMRYTVEKTATDWSFDVYSNIIENSHVNHGSGTGYIPLLAYFLVNKYKDGTSGKLNIITKVSGPDDYISLIILKEYGNRLAEGFINIENCAMGQVAWTAYVQMHKQFGHMTEVSDSIEKRKWLEDNDVKSGDVVLLYEIGKGNNLSNRELTSCKIAIVNGIYDMNVGLDIIGTTELVLTQIERVSHIEYSNKTKEEYEGFYKRSQTISYTSLGIEYLVCDEDNMIMLPTPDDISTQLMILPDDNGEWQLKHVVLDTIETIYAVLENRGIKYNKERFLNKYFKDRVPFYDRFRKHQPTKYENISKSELIEKYGEGAE